MATRRLRAFDERARVERCRTQPKRGYGRRAARSSPRAQAPRREQVKMKAARRLFPAVVTTVPIGAFAVPVHDALRPAGPQAEHIAELWWVTFSVCAVVFVAVLAVLAWGLWRAPRGDPLTPPAAPARGAEKHLVRWVTAAVSVSVILLI